MKIRTKVLLVIILTWGLILGGTYLGSMHVLQKSYSSLEEKQILADFNILNQVIDRLTQIDVKTTTTWSNWDETYSFAIEKDPVKKQKYIDANLTASTWTASGVDLDVIHDMNGNLIYAGMVNADKTKAIPLSADIAQMFEPGGKLRKMVFPPTNTQGLVSTNEGVLTLASQKIFTTNGEGETHGTQIIGTFLTDDIWKKVSADLKSDIVFYPLSAIKKDAELKREYSILLTKPYHVVITSDKILSLYTFLRDINNDPIGIIKTISQRNIHLVGVKTIHYFNIAFITIGILSALLLFYLLRILVITRLDKINKKVLDISTTKNFTLRVPDDGTDELSSVGRQMNKMLSTIQEVEKLLTDTINFMPSSMIIMDKHFKITNLNHLAEKESGFSTKTASGKYLFDLFPYLKNYKERFNFSIEKRIIQQIDQITLTTDSGVKNISVLIYPLSGEDKNMVVRIDDISSRIQFEQIVMQRDRLASIGTLTAGVAHEINNPVNFIYSSTEPLKKDLKDVFTVLGKYSDLKLSQDNTDFSTKLDVIEKLKKSMDFGYGVDEVNRLIEGLKEGANRTENIVKNLRVFSSDEKDKMKKTNIHDGIESTLLLLQGLYQDRINIIKQYEKLPEIECLSGKINQVIMNIVTNAIDAIPDKGEIIINTEQDQDFIRLSVKDNGIGISKENISKVFDPFFTTKPVGKGTGLGLSIASSIMKTHHGSIEVKSELGQGAEFTIILPVNQPEVTH